MGLQFLSFNAALFQPLTASPAGSLALGRHMQFLSQEVQVYALKEADHLDFRLSISQWRCPL